VVEGPLTAPDTRLEKTMETPPPGSGPIPGRLKTIALVIAIVVVTSAAAVWLTTRYLFPKSFQPVALSDKEEKTLEAKLDLLDPTRPSPPQSRTHKTPPSGGDKSSPPLKPEAYSEHGASREVTFTEREINALLAKNTDLAQKLAIDLSENLASAKLLVPLDPEMPFLGGKTLKVTTGLELRYAEGKPVIILKGVSLWGVPVPNAWLGGIKNIDLVSEFGGETGFWKTVAAGVDEVLVTEGRITVRLKE
jgi:hypothetical protein